MYRQAGLIALVAIALLLGMQFLLPINLSYATSGSMEPAIQENDLYLVVDLGSIETGDIITFYSASQEEFVTHRVVDQTNQGFITQGDANAQTDQSAGNPPVHPSSVLGKVVTIAGHPLTIPGAGPVLEELRDYNVILVGILSAVLAVDLLTSDTRKDGAPTRNVPQVRDIVVVILVGSFLASVILVGMGGNTEDISYVVTMEETSAAHTVPQGEVATRSVTANIWALPFTTVYVDVDGATVIEQTSKESKLRMTLEIPPQEDIGLHRASVGTYSYPSTLPYSVIGWLHEVHWMVATVGTLVPVFLPLTVGYFLLLDGKAPIRRGPSRWTRKLGGW